MRTRRKLELFALALVALAVIALVLRNGNQSETREELHAVFTQIQPGASKADVQAIFDARQFQQLKLKDVAPDSLLVQTPLRWGARNWVLWIEKENQKVVAVKIRFQDDRSVRPNNAPEDKVNSSRAAKP